MEPASTNVMHKPAELTALVAIARNSSHRLPQSLPPPRSQLQVWASVTMWPSRLFRDYCLQWLFYVNHDFFSRTITIIGDKI